MNMIKVIAFIFIFFYGLIQTIKVYKFMALNEEEDPSTLEIEVFLPETDSLTICSSHQQYQTNEFSKRMIAIFEDSEQKVPWLTIGFWDTVLWAEVKVGEWYYLGEVNGYLNFINWIHICLEINTSDNLILAAINDGKITKKTTKAIRKIPKNLYFRYLFFHILFL